VARLQVSNVPARDRLVTGVQTPPKSSVKRSRGTWKGCHSARLRDAWQANRKAGPWRGGIEKSEEAKAVL